MIYESVLILKPEMVQIAESARVDSFVKVEGGLGVTIGDCTHVASFCHINGGGGRVTIGRHVGLSSGAKVLGGRAEIVGLSTSAASPPEMQIVTRLHTRIGDYCLIGTNAVVMPGVVMGEGAALGAGGVATKNIPAWEIWAGVPARKIGQRVLSASTPYPVAADAFDIREVTDGVGSYICPICLRVISNSPDVFPRCCGHYMVEKEDWESNQEAWMTARAYEIEKLAKAHRLNV